jgi:hypothetical protein
VPLPKVFFLCQEVRKAKHLCKAEKGPGMRENSAKTIQVSGISDTMDIKKLHPPIHIT